MLAGEFNTVSSNAIVSDVTTEIFRSRLTSCENVYMSFEQLVWNHYFLIIEELILC